MEKDSYRNRERKVKKVKNKYMAIKEHTMKQTRRQKESIKHKSHGHINRSNGKDKEQFCRTSRQRERE